MDEEFAKYVIVLGIRVRKENWTNPNPEYWDWINLLELDTGETCTVVTGREVKPGMKVIDNPEVLEKISGAIV